MQIVHKEKQHIIIFKDDCPHMRMTVENAVSKKIVLQGAFLQDARLNRANLKGANLKGAYLQRAALEGAYLQGAYLQGANLKGAYLQGADLRDANLQGADLRDADLEGAYLNNIKNINIIQISKMDNVYDVIIIPAINQMQIGCKVFSFSQWKEFTDSEIHDMDTQYALVFWNKNKEFLLNLIRN